MKNRLLIVAALVAAFVLRPVALVLGVLLLGKAWAQGMLPTTDPSQLGADVSTMAVTLLFIVQFIKRQFECQGKPLRWWVTLVITLVLGELISALLFYAGYGAKFGNTVPPVSWILFGLVAAVIASGAKDLLTTLAVRSKTEVQVAALPSSQPGQVVTPPAGFQPLFDSEQSQGPGQGQDGDGFPSATRVDWNDVPLDRPTPAWLEPETISVRD
jgi:hypothetical protein